MSAHALSRFEHRYRELDSSSNGLMEQLRCMARSMHDDADDVQQSLNMPSASAQNEKHRRNAFLDLQRVCSVTPSDVHPPVRSSPDSNGCGQVCVLRCRVWNGWTR
jgi:hypothetical protein